MYFGGVKTTSGLALLTSERPRPDVIRNRPDAWRLAVGAVCLGAFMGQLDASIVTLAYGGIGARFHASMAAVEWVSLAYLLTLVALLIPAGRLSDTHGRKLFYLYGFMVFTAASAACALAWSLGSLIAFRAAQAIGAALMQANSVALVTTSAPRHRMRSALGIQAAAQALGLALGPTVGGALVSAFGWRWVFAVNVPVGLLAFVAGHYLLPRTRIRDRATGFDWPGLTALAIATTSALLGVSAASGLPVPGWGVAALLALAALAGWAFVVRQSRAATPLVDLRLLRVRAVSSGLVGALSGYLVLFGPLVLVPVVLAARGASVLTAGGVLTALPAGFAVAAIGADRILPGRLPDHRRCVLGAAVGAVALTVLLLTPHTPSWLVPALALLGLGLGTFTPANNALIMRAIPVGSSGTGGGLVNMARGLGTALGVATMTLALHTAGPSNPAWATATLLAACLLALAASALPASPGSR
jgi:MFS family permease